MKRFIVSLVLSVALSMSAAPAMAQDSIIDRLLRKIAPEAPKDTPQDYEDSLPELGQEKILYGFVPDPDRLKLIPGEELAEYYAGKRIKGIYNITPHSDQRFTEGFSSQGRVKYKEGDFNSNGDWKVEGDQLCFYYDENPNYGHCFYEFTYGDCIIGYGSNRLIVDGLPVRLDRWNSVSKFTTEEFTWEEAGIESARAFSCEAFFS